MSEATYVPGGWVAVAAPSAWLLVDLLPEHDTVQRCWELLRSGAAADTILDVLVAGGIRAMPDFALVCTGNDEQRAIVRGSASIAIIDSAGAVGEKFTAVGR